MSDKSLPSIETVVTYMECSTATILRPTLPDGYVVTQMLYPDYDFYMSLYRTIGRNYIWNYRPGQTFDEIVSILQSETTELYILLKDERAIGMAELDCSDPEDVEIVHFGLVQEETGQRLGGVFLETLLSVIWRNGAKRINLSTCGLDHPKAISFFYRKHGFSIYKQAIATFIDYRGAGFYDKDDAPQIPHGVSFYNGQAGG